MLLRLTLHCDNNSGAHFEELSLQEVSDAGSPGQAHDMLDDMLADLDELANRSGWLLIPAEHKGWTRVLCNKCCARQGGQGG